MPVSSKLSPSARPSARRTHWFVTRSGKGYGDEEGGPELDPVVAELHWLRLSPGDGALRTTTRRGEKQERTHTQKSVAAGMARSALPTRFLQQKREGTGKGKPPQHLLRSPLLRTLVSETFSSFFWCVCVCLSGLSSSVLLGLPESCVHLTAFAAQLVV